MIVRKAVLPAGRSIFLHALNTEIFGRSQARGSSKRSVSRVFRRILSRN